MPVSLPLPIQFPANTPGLAVEDGSNAWVPAGHLGELI